MKTLIFDFDGTIADVLRSHLFIVNELAKDLQLPEFSEADIQLLRSKTIPQLMKDFKIPLFKLPFIIKRAKDLYTKTKDTIVPFEKMVQTLAKLHENNVSMGILTSNSKENVEFFLSKYNIFFFSFLVSDTSIFGKEGKIKKLLKERKLRPDEVYYIGDEVRDIEACKKCNVQCISVTWGLNSRELLVKNTPFRVIDQPEDLLTLQLL